MLGDSSARTVYAYIYDDACWESVSYPWTKLSSAAKGCSYKGQSMSAQCAQAYVLDISLWVSGDPPEPQPEPEPEPEPAPGPSACDASPCEAGGTCIVVPPSTVAPAGFVCKCVAGHSGDTCEHDDNTTKGGGGCEWPCWVGIVLVVLTLCVGIACVVATQQRRVRPPMLLTTPTTSSAPVMRSTANSSKQVENRQSLLASSRPER
eukprot:COSAG05_NODE_5545_length_1145_cov_15295.260038_1_plen_206_part_00